MAIRPGAPLSAVMQVWPALGLLCGFGRGRPLAYFVAARTGFALGAGDEEGNETLVGGLGDPLQAAEFHYNLFKGLPLFGGRDGSAHYRQSSRGWGLPGRGDYIPEIIQEKRHDCRWHG